MKLFHEQSDSIKYFNSEKKKWKLKVESNLSWFPEKSDKICTPNVSDQILKFLLSTEKITRICEWARLFPTLF